MDTAGHPRDFDAKMFLRATADDGTPVQIFGTVHGSAEGSTTQNAKLMLHVDISATLPQGKLSTGFDLLAYQQKIYGKISRIIATGSAMEKDDVAALRKANETYAERWFIMDASSATDDSQSLWKALEDETGISLQQAEVQSLLSALIDAAFALETDRYRAGHAYLITQKSDSLMQMVRVLAASKIGAEAEDLSGIDLNDPELQSMQKEINRTLTMRLKADVSNEGMLQFARTYISFSLPEADDMFFSFEGSMQSRTAPVHVPVPINAIPLEEFIDPNLLPFPLMLPTVKESTEKTPTDEGLNENEQATPIIRLPVSTGCDLITDETDLREARLGDCPVTHESRRALRNRMLRGVHR